MSLDKISKSINNCILKTNFDSKRKFYQGKVRDCYIGKNDRIIIATDRISAFDHVFDQGIPFKGQVLNQIALESLKKTEDIIDNHIIDKPDPNVIIAHECDPIKLEIVVRAYLVGHAFREYKKGNRILCGKKLPENLVENQKLENPILTPTTKAEEGHDLDISKKDAIKKNLITEKLFEQIEETALSLFERGTKIAKEKGLILADTKYEFGIFQNKLMLMDEIHTPDSSRYFYLKGYEEKFKNKETPKHLSKEFVREWLIDKGFQGLEGQKKPDLPDDFRIKVSQRYIDLFQLITGKQFQFPNESSITERIFNNIQTHL